MPTQIMCSSLVPIALETMASLASEIGNHIAVFIYVDRAKGMHVDV